MRGFPPSPLPPSPFPAAFCKKKMNKPRIFAEVIPEQTHSHEVFIPTWSILPSRLLSDYFCHKIAAADEFDDTFDEEFEAAEEPTGILGKIDDSDEELGDAFDSDDDDGGEEDDDNDDDTEDGAAGGVE